MKDFLYLACLVVSDVALTKWCLHCYRMGKEDGRKEAISDLAKVFSNIFDRTKEQKE